MKILQEGKRAAGAALLLTSLALASCGGGGSASSDGNSNGANPTNPIGALAEDRTALPTPVGETVVIKVVDNAFEPDQVTVKPGTIIRWEWDGTSNPHSIVIHGSTSPQQTEGFLERTMDQAGVSLVYQCGVHGAEMRGRIVVQ